MRRRRATREVRPGLERVEAKILFSGGAAAAKNGHPQALIAKTGDEQATARATRVPPLQVTRITNPTPFNARLIPPFRQVNTQDRKPVPGQVYNVVFVSMRNSTHRRFTAADGFFVRVTGQTKAHRYPILTGDQVWRPGQVIVVYFLTKRYYPLSPVTSAGFQFDLGGSAGTAIPGPSGFFQRIHYTNAKSFERILNWIVPFGPGAKGHELGLPDTAIWEFLPGSQYIVPL
jgi:hypothetical protein